MSAELVIMPVACALVKVIKNVQHAAGTRALSIISNKLTLHAEQYAMMDTGKILPLYVFCANIHVKRANSLSVIVHPVKADSFCIHPTH